MSKDGKVARKDLPQVLESSYGDKADVPLMMARALELKNLIGVEPNPKEEKEGSGLLKEYFDLKEELAVHQFQGKFKDGMRHDHIVFQMGWRPGRMSLVVADLELELVAAGLSPEVVKECITKATKAGAPFQVKEIIDLNKPKKPRKDGSKGEWD